MLEVRDVSKQFGSQVVLRSVSLTVSADETVSIVGPSGAGKSVLLKIILGILGPDSGEVLIDGVSMTRLRSERQRNEVRAKLGMLFQSAALFDSLSVYENVAFPLLARGRLSAAAVQKRVEQVLTALSLTPYALCYPQEISMGTRKRVGLARALAAEPALLLIDEPNTGLDPLVGQEVYDLIRASRERWRFAGVVVSHELPEVFQISDRVAMLLGGRVVFDGPPAEVIASTDAAVRQFLAGHTSGPITLT